MEAKGKSWQEKKRSKRRKLNLDWFKSLMDHYLNNKLPIIPTRHRTQYSGPCRQNIYFCQFRSLPLSEISFCIAIKNPFEDWTYSLVIHVSVNGNSKIVEVKNKTPEEIEHWVERLRHESGVKVQKIRKFWHTENPSIQGTWTPFLNKPPSLRRSTVDTLTAQRKFSCWLSVNEKSLWSGGNRVSLRRNVPWKSFGLKSLPVN